MANFDNLSNLTQRVVKKLSLYPGTAVQTYAEDRIADMIISLFIDLFEERFWSFNTNWYKYNLIGIDGVTKEKVSENISDVNDIEVISSENNPRYSLKKLHDSTNPFVIIGDTPTYYTKSSNPEKVFAVVPFTAKGLVYVRARTRPNEYFPETIIPFDADALVSGACYKYVMDDGNSNTQVQRFKEEFENRLMTLRNNENSGTYDWNDEEAYSNTNGWR